MAGQLGPDRDEQRPGSTGCSAIVDGARHLYRRRPAWDALAAMGVHRFAYGITVITTILLCRNYFNDPGGRRRRVRLLALAFGASAVGFGLAAVLTPIAADRWGQRRGHLALLRRRGRGRGRVHHLVPVPVALVGALLLGVCAQASKICVDTIVQEYVDDEFRGRVFSFYDTVFNLAFVVAAVVAALLLPSDGYSRGMFAIVSLLYVLAAFGYGRTVSVVPAAERSGRPV